jgi:alpha-beta hydrolase superfamily lysophospholipase
MNDPLCFAQLQPVSLLSFPGAANQLSDPARLSRIRPDLRIYLFSRSEDPVGQQLDGVQLLIERYRDAGVQNISWDFYPGGRHEMLNETNRAEVVSKLLGWVHAVSERNAPGEHA